VSELETLTRRIFELIDTMDTKGMSAMIADDAQGIDEISRGWMRGREALEGYFGQLEQMVDEVSSKVRNVHETEWGDAGLVTCVVDQTYEMDGAEQSITAPTSIVFRREGGEWKIAMFHSVPLPDEGDSLPDDLD
jgi:ketosteroid isomerase-like protein